MFNRYYQQELSYLKELAVEFSKAHPALAPMLSGQSQDPDVERLLEGVAFSAGLLRQKLDDEFPEIIHGLMDIIFPHYLRPIPAASILTFSPKPGLKESLVIPQGTSIASIPVEGTPCIFSNCFDVTVHPLRLADARLVEQPGQAVQIRLSLELTGVNLTSWGPPERLRFYLGGSYVDASNLYLLLNRHIRNITVKPKLGGRALSLPPQSLKPVGFSKEEALIPYPGQSFPGYRLIQEYFLLPQKFLFMEIEGLNQWTDRGDGNEFDIVFELDNPPFYPSRLKPEDFVLFASPIINIFNHNAVPITMDHRRTDYHVRPSGAKATHYQVYSVDSVTGIVRGSVERKEYAPFEHFSSPTEDRPAYQIIRRLSPVDNSAQLFLSLPYSEKSGVPVEETLSVILSCTNGTLPESLQLGDISQPTSTSPELMEFKNIIPPTAPVQPPIGGNTLWRFLSHLSLNYLSMADTQNLKELLNLYIFPEGRDKAKIAANLKRIEGINDVRVTHKDRLVSGHMMRGQEIRVSLRQDHFAGPGDMYLFSSILDHFLAGYASINCFTRLFVRDTITGEIYQWQPRMGDTPLV